MGIKLVIVDDAPFIREAIKGMMAQTDIQIVGEATNGQEAIQLVLKLKPDLVLMDLVMPEKNGIDACKEILEKMPTLKIVACSTLDDKKFMMKALEAGCCSYVVKPFERAELIKILKKAGEQ